MASYKSAARSPDDEGSVWSYPKNNKNFFMRFDKVGFLSAEYGIDAGASAVFEVWIDYGTSSEDALRQFAIKTLAEHPGWVYDGTRYWALEGIRSDSTRDDLTFREKVEKADRSISAWQLTIVGGGGGFRRRASTSKNGLGIA